MPDPNVTITAIETHLAALDGANLRHSTNAGRCKMWSVGILAGVMVFAGGKAQMGALPWVGGVVLVLAMADACHVALGRRATAAYNAFMRKLPQCGSGGGDAMMAVELQAWQRGGGVASCRHVHDHDSAGG